MTFSNFLLKEDTIRKWKVFSIINLLIAVIYVLASAFAPIILVMRMVVEGPRLDLLIIIAFLLHVYMSIVAVCSAIGSLFLILSIRRKKISMSEVSVILFSSMFIILSRVWYYFVAY